MPATTINRKWSIPVAVIRIDDDSLRKRASARCLMGGVTYNRHLCRSLRGNAGLFARFAG
ncbi:hypothetical protein [Musicola keenii]|uniref:hypothetical protein n=1 Tax=Musicola keenii TaxID=2884250 RepID=UPI00177A98EC|nr:hypothetical protein [Musicola keenii]